MTEIVQGLFGVSPEQLQMQQDQALQARAMQYAQMSPQEQATSAIYTGVSKLGGALGGMLGGVDPVQQQASKIASVLQGADQSTAEGMAAIAQRFSDAGLPQQAQMAIDKARVMKQSEATLSQTQAKTAQEAATARAAEYKITQDEELRTKLAELPADASQEDMMKVVMKYGSPDKVLQVVQMSADKQAARDQAAELQKERLAAKLEADLRDAKNEKEREALRAQNRRELAQLVSSLKSTTAKESKPLSAGLQKDEINDLATIDTYTAQQEALAPSILNLTPDAKGLRKLELGPLKNAEYVARNAAGKSTPESRAYEALKSAVDTAVNLQVSAEKGVQTDKDVLRFAQALIASYGRNDTKATLEALTRYQEAIAKAATKVQTRIESRRKSQNVEPYGFSSKPAVGTAENPIKLD